jgi:inner membrane transporter RhtA
VACRSLFGVMVRFLPRLSDDRLARVVAPLLIVVTCFSTQASAGFAHRAFSSLGALNVTAVRFAIAALGLLIIARPKLTGRSAQEWRAIVIFGVCCVVMNAAFYQAVARMPLGNVTSIEFCGPFAIAVVSSKSWREARWVLLAALGVVTLAHPSANATIAGIGFALLAAVGWAMYTLMSKRVGSLGTGLDGLALSVSVAALILLPISATSAPHMTGSQWGNVALSGLTGVTFSFSLEYIALRMVAAKKVSVFFSVDPVAAFVIGLVMLNQPLSLISLVGCACIVVASIAVARHEDEGTVVPVQLN